MTIRRWTSFVSIAFFLVAGGATDASASTQSLLEALRKAMLSRPIASISAIRTTGSIEIVGIRGTMQEWDDVHGVRYTVAQSAGALSGSSGWDGKAAWSQDYAGLVTIDGGAAGRLQAIDQAYLDNLRYLRPDAGGATVVYAGPQTDGDRTYDVLAVTPPHGTELDFWLDPRTHLIARVTGTVGIVTTTTTFSGYRHVDGVTYPFESTSKDSSGNSSTVRLWSVKLNEEVSERMRVPSQNVRDASLSGDASATVPLQIVNNHLYLNVMLDGRGPYTFVLDSGGDYIVTPEVASALQAKSTGGVQLGGVGNATEGAAFTHLGSIGVGNAIVRNQYTLVLPIATGFGTAEGMRIDGMLGYQFLARFLTTIDYADSKLTLTMQRSAPASVSGATAIPFYFSGTIPRIPITVAGVSTTAEVDTGNRAAIDLSTPFLAAHPVIAALAKTPPGVVGFGVGGPSLARLGRLPSVQIGPYQLSNSIASFGVQTKGAFADPFNPVNVGGALLRRFDLTLDYAHQQLLFAKNAQFDAPFTYDRSGLFLIDSDGAFTVLSVFPSSPAAAGGLTKGDVIVGINGAAASSDSLAALRALLSGASGTVVHLRVRNESGQRDVRLTLADYV